MNHPRMTDKLAFAEGRTVSAHGFLGAHLQPGGGTRFAVWAPRAKACSVVLPTGELALERMTGTGIFEVAAPNAGPGTRYHYRITPEGGGPAIDKADPYAFSNDGTSSVVTSLDYAWHDESWVKARSGRMRFDAPMSIYEVHLGSWRRRPTPDGPLPSFREIAAPLAEHAKKMGFTHVELMPLLEHPFYGSWGYGVTGFFSVTRRYGSPTDLMYLVDTLHAAGLGVIFDWVPAHFARDPHGLERFDGQPLFESADPAHAVHPTWGTGLFDFERPEVRSFLLSSALFWVDTFHADGLRVDGVEAILYRDHGKAEAAPSASERTRENPRGIAFLRDLTGSLKFAHPDVWLFAEDSSAWPGITRAPSEGGLGFDFKWDMGFAHDMRRYLALDPIERSHEQGLLTFRSVYAPSERFVLPLSHDDVPLNRGGSLFQQMHGDEWQKLANLRLLLASAWAQPGKKLLFMGSEFGHRTAWDHDRALDWSQFDRAPHDAIARMVRDLNRLHREEPALHVFDVGDAGFEWIDGGNAPMSVVVYARKGRDPADYIAVAMNFTPVPRHQYRIGVPRSGPWRELFNSDARDYGGSGHGNLGAVTAVPYPWNDRRSSVVVTLPPLGAIFLGPVR